MLREERTHLVELLSDLQGQQRINPAPELASAIRKIRRRVLGLYTQVMNKRKPEAKSVDNPPVDKVEMLSYTEGVIPKASHAAVSENET